MQVTKALKQHENAKLLHSSPDDLHKSVKCVKLRGANKGSIFKTLTTPFSNLRAWMDSW